MKYIGEVSIVLVMVAVVLYILYAMVMTNEIGLWPCEHEDGPAPCYWDASERGNGEGKDFIMLKNGDVIYSD